VFGRLRQDLQKLPSQLQESAGRFTEAAGPYRTWEGIGGQQTIASTLRPERGKVENLEPARALVEAQYQGPGGLDLGDLAGLQEAAGELGTRAGSLETAGGIQNALQEQTAGLSAGERAFEARRYLDSPEYRAQAREGRQDVARLQSELARVAAESEAIAGARQAQEADIASQARGLLTGEEGAIQSDLVAKVAAEEDKNQAIRDAYTRFQETGDPAALKELEQLEGVLQGFKPEDFATEARTKTQEALGKRAEILQKYEDLKDVPLLTLQATSRGHETIGFPEEWYAEAKKRYSKDELEAIRARAMERQRELEGAGFASKYSKGRYTSVVEGAGGAQESPYGLYAPLYYGEDLELPDVRNFTGLVDEVRPSRENLSSEDQRGVYNRIQDLLSQSDRLAEAGEPYRAAQINAEVGRYLEEEGAAVKAQRGALTENQQTWAQQVRKLHKAHEEQGKFINKAIAKVAKVATGTGIVKIPGQDKIRKLMEGAAHTGYSTAEKLKAPADKIGKKVPVAKKAAS
jgi:hypothetical protein